MSRFDDLDTTAMLNVALIVLAALVAYTLVAGLSIWISAGAEELRLFLSLFAFYYAVALAFSNLASAFHLWACAPGGWKRPLLAMAGLLFGLLAVLCHYLVRRAGAGKEAAP